MNKKVDLLFCLVLPMVFVLGALAIWVYAIDDRIDELESEYSDEPDYEHDVKIGPVFADEVCEEAIEKDEIDIAKEFCFQSRLAKWALNGGPDWENFDRSIINSEDISGEYE